MERIRESLPFIPLPTFTYKAWITLLIAAVVILAGLSPLVFRGARLMIPESYFYGIVMLANGLLHLTSSLYVGRWMPGVYSSPLLLARLAIRRREFAMRMVLGAQPRDILKLILKQGLVPVLVGIVIGLGGAYAATRVLSSFLYGVTATDPATFVGVALLLTGVALVACYIPARRATKIDPMIALRYE